MGFDTVFLPLCVVVVSNFDHAALCVPPDEGWKPLISVSVHQGGFNLKSSCKIDIF